MQVHWCTAKPKLQQTSLVSWFSWTRESISNTFFEQSQAALSKWLLTAADPFIFIRKMSELPNFATTFGISMENASKWAIKPMYECNQTNIWFSGAWDSLWYFHKTRHFLSIKIYSLKIISTSYLSCDWELIKWSCSVDGLEQFLSKVSLAGF